jgi:peptidoglycan/xylan/chitin deacetylase (PgdA/CDA1 family)
MHWVATRNPPHRLLRFCAVVLTLWCLHTAHEVYNEAIAGVPADAIRLANKPGVVYWHGDRSRRAVALTFDDGPSADTLAMLDVLARYQVHATFFMVGARVDAHPEIARAVVAAGHTVGNHTFHHERLVLKTPDQVKRELAAAQRSIERATGVRPTLYRPPFGAEDTTTRDVGRHMGLVAVDWSDSSKDWKRPGVDRIVANVLASVTDGAVILMHDGGGDRKQTVEAIARLIPELRARGFELVTVPELIQPTALR